MTDIIEKFKNYYLKDSASLKKNETIITLLEEYRIEASNNGVKKYSLLFEGIIEDLKKNYDKAISLHQKAIDEENNFAYAWAEMGSSYLSQRNYEKARECLKKAIICDPNFPQVWLYLGLINDLQKKYRMAMNYYKLACKKTPALVAAFFLYGNSLASVEQYEKAIEWLKKAINIDNNLPDPWYALGSAYNKQRNIEKAIECYLKAIEIDENHEYSYYGLGLVNLDIKNYTLSKHYLSKALHLFEVKGSNYWISLVKEYINTIDEMTQSDKILQTVNDDNTFKVLNETSKSMEEKVFQNKNSFSDFIINKPKTEFGKKTYFEVLRRWNSYTPIIADNYHISKGGGYFFKTQKKGIVIDPGFNFIDNFKGAGHFFCEIDVVLVSHAHNDHTSDIESILTLLHKYNEEIKGLEDFSRENTIRSDIAIRDNINIRSVSIKDIEDEFLVSMKRKIITFYITLSVFKKYSGLFDLFDKNDYEIHIIEQGDAKNLDDKLVLSVIAAKHNDIVSDRHSVGFIIDDKENTLVIYSGDTGWDAKIEQQYIKIADEYKGRAKLLIAHIGGFKEYEKDYIMIDKREKSYYKNHLGRIGITKINEILTPNYCFISEFGEELRGFRIKLSQIYSEIFKDIIFLPADIGLCFNIYDKTIKSIVQIETSRVEEISPDGKSIMYEKSTLKYDYMKPEEVSVSELKKDYSLHYYYKRASFSESDLVQVLLDNYERSIK